MTKKPNFWKCIMGIVVLSLLFVGTWAATSARLTSAKKASGSGMKAKTSTPLPLLPAPAPPIGTDLISTRFEVDGDIFDNPSGVPDDWDVVNCDGGNAQVKTFVNDGLGHTIFTQGGSKDPNDIGVVKNGVLEPGWLHTEGSVPDKDEILNAYAAKYIGPSGDTIIAFGADRFANQGDSFFGVWFFQKKVYAAPDGTFKEQVGAAEDPATDPLAQHSVGDILILMSFSAGGTFGTGEVFEWVGTGGNVKNNPSLNSITDTAPVGSVLGVINGDPAPPVNGTGPQDIPDNCGVLPGQTQSWNALYTPKPSTGSPGIIPIADFFEGAINLDAFPALRGLCLSSFLVETRSSSSVSAQLKDFVLGDFNTCVDVSLTKTATDVCEGTAVTYTYTVTNSGGVSANFTLTDDNETGPYTEPFDPSQIQADDIDVGADNNCATQIGAGTPTSFSLAAGAQRVFQCTILKTAGTHTNTAQTTGSSGSSTKSDVASATAHVFVNPVAAAGADQSVCQSSSTKTFNLNATAGTTVPPGGTIQWSGTGINFGSPNSLITTAEVTSFGTFTATLTITSPAAQNPACPQATDSLTLTLSQNPVANAGPDLSACEDTASHQFTISGSSATVPAGSQITWSGPAGVSFDDIHALHPVVTVTAFGTVTLTMSVNNPATGDGCVPASDTVNLTLNQNPVIQIDDVTCSADGTPQTTSIGLTAQITAGGGTTNTFVWVVPAGATNPGNSASLTTSTPGLYTVTVTATHSDGSVSCVGTKSKFVGLCASDPNP